MCSATPTSGKHHDFERGTRPRARRASRHMPGRPSFDPKPASRPRLKLTSASPRVLAGFGCDGCRWSKWWLQFHIWLPAAWPAWWHDGNGSCGRCRARESAARSLRKRPSGSFLSWWPSAACSRGVSCVSRAVARVRHCRIGSGRLVARSLRTLRAALGYVRHLHGLGRCIDRGRSLGRYGSRVPFAPIES